MIPFEDYFDLEEGVYYLNHAAVSPWPIRTTEVVTQFAMANQRRGSLEYLQWLETEKTLRKQLQRHIQARSEDEIALVKNTSEGLSIIAYGLDWQQGDNVVGTDQEFPSNRIVWESLASKGVTFRPAPLTQHDTPEEAIFAQVDENTRMIAISSVEYGSGLRLDLETIGRYCQQHNILFCVDAIQSIGALAMDVEKFHIDFLAADGHKWMMGPEGLGVFYCRKERMPMLHLNQYGWHMVEQVGNFDRTEWEIAASARRFECGSPNMVAVHALHASLSIIDDLGIEAIETQVLTNSEMLFAMFNANNHYSVLTPQNEGRYAGIVTVKPLKKSSQHFYEQLTQAGIFCAPRGGGVRFSPHFYTPSSVLEYLQQQL